MTIDFVFLLMLFTLGGGLVHAIMHLRATRRMMESGEDTGGLPRVYRRRTRNPGQA
ncbi:MAG: hypothetical protein AAGG47_13795 [Pseudomonadota bacterium]